MARYAAELCDGDAARAATALEEAWPVLVDLRGEASAEPPAEQLFAALRREVLTAQRGAGAMQRLDDAEGAASDAGSEQGESEEDTVARVFARLTPKQQEALRLKFTHGFRHGQIAVILGLPATHAAQLVHNALGRVARVLAVRRGKERPAGPDDPRLTLAALDEISAEEAAGLAAGIPDAKIRAALVEDLRGTARLVATAIARGKRRRPATRPRSFKRSGIAAMGAVALLATGWWWMQRAGDFSGESAAPADQLAGAARVAVRRAEEAASVESAAQKSETLAVAPSGKMAPTRGKNTGAPAASAVPPTQSGIREAADAGRTVPPRTPDPAGVRNAAEADRNAEPAAEGRGAPGAAGSREPAAELRGERDENPVSAPPAAAPETMTSVSTPADRPTGNPADIAPILALRRALGAARWPQPEEVNVAALQRYFSAAVCAVPGGEPVQARVERAMLPWRGGGQLVRATATAAGRDGATRAAANVVLLLDVSASMDAPNRMPLVQEAIGALLGWLQPGDRVGLVTYAGEAQVLFPLAAHAEMERLRAAVFALEADGRTNGGAGLKQAYALTAADPDGVRQPVVILCTDGEFNMGQSNEEELGALVDGHRARGVRLAIFGFGRNGAIDPRLEALAARAQGGSGYVNTSAEAVAVLARQLDPLFSPVVRDVRLGLGSAQVEAPELYPGERVEIVTPAAGAAPAGTLRYRAADGTWAEREPAGAGDGVVGFGSASAEFRFAAIVREFGEILRAGPAEARRLEELESWVQAALPEDTGGYRRELLALFAQARAAAGR